MELSERIQQKQRAHTLDQISTSEEPFPRYSFALPFSERRLLLFGVDMLLLGIAGLLAIWGRALLFGEPGISLHLSIILWLGLLAGIWMTLAIVNECYDLRTTSRSGNITGSLLATMVAGALTYLLLFFLLSRPIAIPIGTSQTASDSLKLFVQLSPPRTVPLLFFPTAFVLVTLWRMSYIKLFTSAPLRRRLLVVGAGWAGKTVVTALKEHLPAYEITGLIDDDPAKQEMTIAGVPVLGTRENLLLYARRLGVSEIVLAITHEIHTDMFRALMDCYEAGIAIRPMPVLYEQILGQIPVEHLGRKWFPAPLWDSGRTSLLYRPLKRGIDIVVSVLGLTVMAPLFPFVAAAIYLDSPGAIFYRQTRLGKGGRPFELIKLRSMIPNAEQAGAAVWARKNDVRITRVGNFLRRTRLDEIPQLINVLKGEMSIIGPRPERPEFVDDLQDDIPFYRARLSVKPGLTGWAQTKYRYGNSVDDARIKLQYDLFYIKNHSIILDILILMRTVKVVLTFRGT